MAEDQDSPDGTILGWYDARKPLTIDLIGDYAGKELFIVEGDSLLRECFEDERIDFKDGFQMLHAVFVVERFLDNLIKRHCQFHIVFFDENRELCVPPGVKKHRRGRFLLARSVIIRHLILNLSESIQTLQVHTFPSLRSKEFDSYLEVAPVHFVMAHDGALSATHSSEPETDVDIRAKILLRSNISWFNSLPLNVALLNRIEFRDSKVFTMILEEDEDVKWETFKKESDKEWDELVEEDTASDEELLSERAAAVKTTLARPEIQAILSSDDIAQESWLLSASSIIAVAAKGPIPADLLSAFVLHIVLIKHLALSQRRLPLIRFEGKNDEKLESFIAEFVTAANDTMTDKNWVESMRDNEVDYDLVDIIDGRLFRVLYEALSKGALEASLPAVVLKEWKVAVDLFQSITGEKLSLKPQGDTKMATVREEAEGADVGEAAVMSFTNPIFDKHLECIHIETEKTSAPSRQAALRIYRETTHWHNHRKPLNPKLAPEVKVSKWKNPLRLNQFYMAEMTSYAASLTGAKGKALEPETITVGPKNMAPAKAEEAPAASSSNGHAKKPTKASTKADEAAGSKKGTKKAATGLTKAQQIVAKNREEKGGAESAKAFSSWVNVMKDYDELSADQDRYMRAKAYLDGLDSIKTSHVDADINLYLLQTQLSRWGKFCQLDKKPEGYHVAATIWTIVRSICASKAPLTKALTQVVEKVCTLMAITNSMYDLGAPTSDRKLSFVFKWPANEKNLSIVIPQADFQLLHCGPYMDRYLDARPDPRVSFTPDGWQRNVLDELDADNSVFVVAPTSAGKTFISFYAMEKVLRDDDDGVLVYVAPTKALVNQIAAEIQGRFSKKFPRAGKSVWAIHTRDYRVNNATGCQILVTVPHVLQIMLMAPSNAKSWAPRVRRIIFDEIHSIGNAEDGVVWEQLLLLAPCPIIALSATIGNPKQFADWLTETQKASGTKLTMIQHSTRYSDLRKYIYNPPKIFSFNGLGKSKGVGLGLDGLSGLTFFHPVASLIDKARGMPDDLALEPRDCFLLWKAMCKLQQKGYEVPDSLDPVKALPPCIKKADIFKWEKELKVVLQKWMADSKSPFDKVVRELSPEKIAQELVISPASTVQHTGLNTGINTPLSDTSKVSGIEQISKVVNPHDLGATTLPLLLQLHQRQALPAILFNYDRSGCEEIGQQLLDQLKAAENVFKQGKAWQRKLEGWAQWKELKDKKGAKKPAKPTKSKGGDDDEKSSKADQARDDASAEISNYDFFDPEEPQDDFSFADKRRCQKSELDEYLRQLKWKRIPGYLIELLQRGVGVHHSGMNRKYRQCVEMLFRKGFLRVVIATGTLSMGINMPCATVVFSGDSVYLTALNFRQAAGRSGRRGFDLLGNVVFQGITKQRASRLLSSRLPDLTGHFPFTTTLVLRLFTLLYDSKNSPYAVKAVNSLLSHPRLYLGGVSFKEQVLHHLRFSIEYLRRQKLLGPLGEPVNWTSCVSHLYFTENSSFAFHALLKDGYFSRLCSKLDKQEDKVLRKMMLVLSHIFGRETVRITDNEVMTDKIRRSPSVVYLPPMPKKAAAILREHNAQTLDIFTTYVKTFAEQHATGEELHLPLSKVSVGGSNDASEKSNVHAIGEAEKKEFDLSFLPILPAPHARSPFVALSGHGDDFTTIADLCSSTRSGIFLESAIIPHLELHPDESLAPLNAYLLDFFMHGAVEPLEEANGIRRSEVWFKLNDFSLVLATIQTSLANYLGLGKGGGDEDQLDVMGGGDAAENDNDEEEAANSVPVVAPAALTGVAPTGAQGLTATGFPIRKGKKNVADDWDADEDAMVAKEKIDAEVLGPGVDTDDEEYDKLMHVYRAFTKLKKEFDSKFREIWA